MCFMYIVHMGVRIGSCLTICIILSMRNESVFIGFHAMNTGYTRVHSDPPVPFPPPLLIRRQYW